MMINYYLYDESFVFVGSVSKKDQFQTFPAHSTKIEPPELSEGQYAVFMGNEWNITTERPAVLTPVPSVVPMNKARLAIFKSGLTDTVMNAINSLPEPQKTEVLIEWEYSTKVTRDNPLVVLLTSNIGLTAQEIDDLFILADSLRD